MTTSAQTPHGKKGAATADKEATPKSKPDQNYQNALDESLSETFPASDPISPKVDQSHDPEVKADPSAESVESRKAAATTEPAIKPQAEQSYERDLDAVEDSANRAQR